MEFKLILTPETPDKVLLKAEKPLSGLAFIEKASTCLRRNLDTMCHMRHITLGTVAQYEISVPQAVAIESGCFQNESVVYLPCEENILAKYLFYSASMAKGPNNRPCYPYYQNEIVLMTYVDELSFIDVWRQRGFPKKMTINLMTADIPVVDDAGNVKDPVTGDLILDDLLRGDE